MTETVQGLCIQKPKGVSFRMNTLKLFFVLSIEKFNFDKHC